MSNSNGSTPERWERARAAIHRWKAWQPSTGPRAREGKAQVAQNANKGATLRLHDYREMLKVARAGLPKQQDLLQRIWS